MRTLPLHFDVRGDAVALVGTGQAAEAKARLIEAAGGRIVRPPALAGARLAFVALDDEAQARQAADQLRADGLLVNVVDRPALCDFSVPAIVDRETVVISISTGGASASLAKALRERLEVWLPAELGALADRIFAAREPVAGVHKSSVERRRFWDRLLRPGGALDPLAPVLDPSRIIAKALADGPETSPSLQRLRLSSRRPDDLTLGQLRLLQQADIILHRADAPPAVLALARRDARLIVSAPEADSSAHAALGMCVVELWLDESHAGREQED